MNTGKNISVCLLLIVFQIAVNVCSAAQMNDLSEIPLQAGPSELEWFRGAKFGMFIHWAPVSLLGTEIGWSRGGERRGTGGAGSVPVEVYDNLCKSFYPACFDAKKWAELAKEAGARYVVFTAKHHDGFCMFDSNLTDFKITNGPFKRDITAELAQACHEAGLKLGLYYSTADWYHPDYRTERQERYIEYMHGQLRELCTNYGNVDIVWFDGGKNGDDSEKLFRMMRGLQPAVLINQRYGLPGDFDTPEQEVGRFQTDRAWESCVTLGTQWAWKSDDKIKPFEECINLLVRCAGGDGNLLLNTGPMPTGEIEPGQAQRFREIGEWLRTYGESIYGTRGGPFKPGCWGVSTYKDNFIYLHVLSWEDAVLKLPPIGVKIKSCQLLNADKPVKIEQNKEGISIVVPSELRDNIDTIIKLQLEDTASQIAPCTVISGSLMVNRPVAASNVHKGMAQFAAENAVDNNPSTRWATDWDTKQAWLEVDLGKSVKFNRVKIREGDEFAQVCQFELQYKDGRTWHTFLSGNTIGNNYSGQFDSVTSQYVRLNILDIMGRPRPTSIWEFQLFAQ